MVNLKTITKEKEENAQDKLIKYFKHSTQNYHELIERRNIDYKSFHPADTSNQLIPFLVKCYEKYSLEN